MEFIFSELNDPLKYPDEKQVEFIDYVMKLREQNKKMREVLEWYANRSFFDEEHGIGVCEQGQRARDVLKEIDNAKD